MGEWSCECIGSECTADNSRERAFECLQDRRGAASLSTETKHKLGRDMPSPSPKQFGSGNIQVYTCVRGKQDCNCRSLRFEWNTLGNTTWRSGRAGLLHLSAWKSSTNGWCSLFLLVHLSLSFFFFFNIDFECRAARNVVAEQSVTKGCGVLINSVMLSEHCGDESDLAHFPRDH